MFYQLIVSLLLISSALSATYMRRGYVEWFEIEKPLKTHRILGQKEPIFDFKPYDQAWIEFKDIHGKSYEGQEELNRYQIFSDNLRRIEEHNQKFKEGKSTYIQGVNQFADMTNDEFVKYNGLKKKSVLKSEDCSTFMKSLYGKAPDTVDWRDKGYVTPVKNQGQCGSCWSFSTTGSLEGQYFRKTGNLVSFSEQQLVDCSGSYGNEGCNGGLMDQAFAYVKVKGIEREEDYQYTAHDDKCKYDKSKIVTKDSGCVDVESGSESSLKNAVAEEGPISVAIDASHSSFQLYSKGVYDEPKCSSENLDHGVLVVGYGVDDESGSDYWLVKNSWGTSWGMDGYIKMSRNQDNQCGIATSASYPTM